MSDEAQEVQSSATGTEISGGVATESTITPAEASKAAETVAGSQETAPEVPQYTPNFKFAYSAKKEGATSPERIEREFDDFVKSGIKDSESEKKARELYEKAYGLDLMKPNYEDLKKKYPELENNYRRLDSEVTEILDIGQKDLGMFFERLKIPEERVAQWMLERIRKMELPPEQKAMYDNFEETKRQNLLLQKQFQELNGLTQQQAVQARTLELESSLQNPEVSSFAAAFDAARKQHGAFRNEIREYGLAEWKINGNDISAAEATQRVMSRYSGMLTPPAIGADTTTAAEKPLPVIPRMQGKSVSSIGKQVRSIDDLKKKYTEVAG